jgi:serine/threonine-protein kinase PknK
VSEPDLPQRYQAVARLGQGGGGEVWAVRDRVGATFALKVLAEDASEREMAALVREAAALSGLEGLGLPRVTAFGRLPRTGRAFMVRELVEGRSLDALMHEGGDVSAVLRALIGAADQLTVLHRTGLLHGDVKPANIIVGADQRATLVDLGLAAPFREGGTSVEGLSPRYAAPELFEGKPLTVRAEVYALGVALSEAISESKSGELGEAALGELGRVAARATAVQPQDRYPSVDELASAVRRILGLPATAGDSPATAALWPVTGIDSVSTQLLQAAHGLSVGAVLRLQGAAGSGRTALLRRLAWSLGVEGLPVVFLDAGSSAAEISAELAVYSAPRGVFLLVDEGDALDAEAARVLVTARDQGARLVVVTNSERFGAPSRSIDVPPLDERAARELVRRAIPSLGEALVARVVELGAGRPGELQRLVRRIAGEAVASAEDIERIVGASGGEASLPSDPLERGLFYLERGRYADAEGALALAHDPAPHDALRLAVARARVDVGKGDVAKARERLEPYLDDTALTAADRDEVSLYLARAHYGLGEYSRVLELLEPLRDRESAVCVEALAVHALALSLVGRREEARIELEEAVARAKRLAAPRIEALVLASQGLELQRADLIDAARAAYEAAIAAAERAGDAGTLAVVRANLAGLLKVSGDIAGAIEQFEAALDMGRRSGRGNTARQALLNLANVELYLGRIARTRAHLETLLAQESQMPPMMRAQLSGLRAELAVKDGKPELAVQEFEASAAAYEALGRGVDAAEARLEGVLAAVRLPQPDLAELRRRIEKARNEIGEVPAHRPLLLLASARVLALGNDEGEARRRLDEALGAARDAGQREWSWRALEARAELEEAGGQPLLARRDREEAVAVLEEIGARLPRDLREVYWDDARRSRLRTTVPAALGAAATEFAWFEGGPRVEAKSSNPLSSATTNLSQMSATPLERRLSRLLEVNAELTREHDLGRLTARITDYAVELARAERGLVLLRAEDGSLEIHASRSRGVDLVEPEFSRSIAEQVMASREPLVALNAQSDARIKGYSSVHQMMLESVACVPILAPNRDAIGALYVETRARTGAHFERELLTLRAFADQVAIALENARLLNENQRRADELSEANEHLAEARDRLRELLGDRTEQLKRARRRLKDVRETLYGHFGYHGLVGTSAAMRRVYSLIERVKDTDVPVLITGESGTGKEVVARAIHETSPRSKVKMLGVNCGAIPENLLESELFGHVRGAFTGADRERKGLFRECDGGTILLDEIGETPAKMQAGLLRVLQEHTVRPVGGNAEQAVDVRVIFATNRDLKALVREGRFREDLYYRIQVIEIHIPPLRERREDIPQLADHFLGIFSARYKREKALLSRDALRLLSNYDWPGNVRQFENVLLNAWVMSEEEELLPEDFDLPMGRPAADPRLPTAAESKPAAPAEGLVRPEGRPERTTQRRQPKGTTSEHYRNERERILDALRACNWNRVKAAELSGIPRRTFYRRLREYGIQ